MQTMTMQGTTQGTTQGTIRNRTMRVLAPDEIDAVSGAMTGPETMGVGLGLIGLGLGIAAAPIGLLGLGVAVGLSWGGGLLTGTGVYDTLF